MPFHPQTIRLFIYFMNIIILSEMANKRQFFYNQFLQENNDRKKRADRLSKKPSDHIIA